MGELLSTTDDSAGFRATSDAVAVSVIHVVSLNVRFKVGNSV